MRLITLACVLIFCSQLLAQEEIASEYTSISYAQFFDMLTDDADTILILENVLIEYNPDTDSLLLPSKQGNDLTFNRTDTLYVRKEIRFNKVFSSAVPDRYGSGNIPLNHMIFEKVVSLSNSGIRFHHCVFQEQIRIKYDEPLISPSFNSMYSTNIVFCRLENGISYDYTKEVAEVQIGFALYSSDIISKKRTWFKVADQTWFYCRSNQFSGQEPVHFEFRSTISPYIEENHFSQIVHFSFRTEFLSFTSNVFKKIPVLFFSDINEQWLIGYNQFTLGFIDDKTRVEHRGKLLDRGDSVSGFKINRDDPYNVSDQFLDYYTTQAMIQDDIVYRGEMNIRGQLRNLYLSRADTEYANAVFRDMKDLETKRFAYLYRQNPSFRSYFKWKINQFLKLFVDYGTEPAKAIVFALYVIISFALIYLFFPNSWDAHGRTRIMDRYRFFLKYLNQKEGASEVYLEEKNKELLPFHEFKQYLEEQGKTAPKFFYATALPLYKWSISGTKLSGWLLSKIDVLKGTWSELPKSGRWLKSAMVIGTFLIALLYDLFIKILNAVMLSINTFTTLGFGEIPIKGLPRYLAIIQGFIGWFMLTIFSVSLITQLLN